MTLNDDLAQYRSAVTLLEHDHSSSPLHQEAVVVVTTLGPKPYNVFIPCLVCGDDYTEKFTVQQVASWLGKPRGVCGTCAKRATPDPL